MRQLRQARGGAAQAAGDVEQVPGPRAGAEQGFAAPNRADQHDVSHGEGRFGQIAAGQRGFWAWQETEALEEAGEPGAVRVASRRLEPCDEIAGQAEGEKGSDGPRAHGGQVAESAGKGAMADGFRRVPIEAEVAAGDGEIGGDGQFLAGAQAEQGAVVADAQPQRGIRRSGRAGANPGQQR